MSLYPTPARPKERTTREWPEEVGFQHDYRGHWRPMLKSQEDLSQFIPTDALMAGFELLRLEFERDPWYLYRDGHIVYEWDRAPSLTDVTEMCHRLIRR